MSVFTNLKMLSINLHFSLTYFFQKTHSWLKVSNLTLIAWTKPVFPGLKQTFSRPTVALQHIKLSECYWNVLNLNTEILKCDLTEMTLNIQGNGDRKARNEVNIKESRPLIVFDNSTIKHFIGADIQLNMFDSLIEVNTVDIFSPMFVMRSSIVDLSNCTFHGSENVEKQDYNKNGIGPAVIFYVEESRMVIQECLFENIQVDMSYPVSAAVCAINSHVEVFYSIFTKNTAHWAVINGLASKVTVSESVFSFNTGNQGASFNVQKNSSLQVHNSNFTNNNAPFAGGAMTIAYTSTAMITSCVFRRNSAYQGGALDDQDNSSVSITDSIFEENKADSTAGALFVSFTSASMITSCVFRRNTVHQHGGALQATDYSSIYIANSALTDNTADLGGALAIVFRSAVKITSSEFKGNSAHQGAVVNVQNNGLLSIDNSRFIGNYADAGGVILAMKNAILQVETSTFVENHANSSGAVFSCGPKVNITMSTCTFVQNMASKYGGVVEADANTHVVVNQCNFSHNDAKQGSVLFLSNSQIAIFGTVFSYHHFNMIYIQSSELFLNGCHFANNSLRNDVLMQIEGGEYTTVIKNSHFIHNRISGIITSSSASVSINRCKFANNIANGIFNAVNILLTDTMIHNNSIFNTGILYNNATITLCTFTLNSAGRGYGLISSELGKIDPTLLVEQSTFLHNQGDVIREDSSVDIVLNACNFTGNNGELGILTLWNTGASLRIANTTINAPSEGNKVAAYFKFINEQTKMTDFLTYDTCLITGNITLNSSSTENFLRKAEAAGLVVIEDIFHPYCPSYKVTQEETVFASGKSWSTIKSDLIIYNVRVFKMP